MKHRKSRRVRAARPAPKRVPGAAASTAANSSPESLPPIGAEGVSETSVRHSWTIQALDPRLPAVLSTPAMIGLMEHATVLAASADLPEGAISVGTRIEVDHRKAVPPGARVRTWARLVKHEGRFLIFEVEARSGDHLIGKGLVARAVVEPEKHSAKAHARLHE